MKNPLNKRLVRELWHNKSRYLIVALFAILTIMLNTSFFSVQQSIKQTYYDSLESGKVEDGQLTFAQPLTAEQTKVFADKGVDYRENFYLSLDIDSDKKSSDRAVVRLFKNDRQFNKIAFFEGKRKTDDHSIQVERIFAQNNKLKIGDKIKIAGQSFEISGIIALADYSTLLRKNSDILPDYNNFCLATINPATFDKLAAKHSLTYRYAYRLDDRNMSLKQQTDKLEDLAKSFVKQGQVPVDLSIRSANKNISFFADDAEADSGSMIVFFAMLMAILAFVFSVMAGDMIDKEARTIGALLALGYSKLQLIMHYLLVPIVVTIGSIVIGNVLTLVWMNKEMLKLYSGNYSMYPIKLIIRPDTFLLTAILPALLILVVNLIYLIRKLRFSPMDFLRKDLAKRRFKHALPLPKIGFIGRFRLRVLLRNLGSFLVLALGIFVAQVLIIFSQLYQPMIDGYLKDIKETTIADYQVMLKRPLAAELAKRKEKSNTDLGYSDQRRLVAQIVNQPADDLALSTIATLETDQPLVNNKLSVTIYGLDLNHLMMEKWLNSDHIDEGQVYVSEGAKHKLGLKIGDKIKLYDKYRDREYQVEVAGTTKAFASSVTLLFDRDDLNKMLDFESNYYNGIFSNDSLDLPEKEVATIIKSDDMMAIGKILTKQLSGVGQFMIVISAVIFVAVIFVLTKSIIDKYKSEISYLRIFGYSDKEIGQIYIKATTIVLVIIVIVLIPLEKWALLKLFDLAMLKFNGYIRIEASYLLFLQTAAALIVFYYLIRFLLLRKVKQIDMKEALKDVA